MGPGNSIHRCAALTLIEVVAAVTLLGVGLTSILAAQGRAVHAVLEADRHMTAQELAAELIRRWRVDGESIRDEDRGDFAEPHGWSWHRTSHPQPIGSDPRYQRVVLTILHTGRDGRSAPWSREFHWLVEDVTRETR